MATKKVSVPLKASAFEKLKKRATDNKTSVSKEICKSVDASFDNKVNADGLDIKLNKTAANTYHVIWKRIRQHLHIVKAKSNQVALK